MNNSNILVVEDDAAIRSLITTALETENYKYHVAKNGNQAIIEATTQTVYVKEEEIHVTPIEYKILCLLAKNLGSVLPHTHITEEIWGSSFEGDIASLRVHVATVRKKIEKKDSSNKCIQTHIGIGYCMVKQE